MTEYERGWRDAMAEACRQFDDLDSFRSDIIDRLRSLSPSPSAAPAVCEDCGRKAFPGAPILHAPLCPFWSTAAPSPGSTAEAEERCPAPYDWTSGKPCPHGLTGEEAAWCLDCESEAAKRRRGLAPKEGKP